MSLRFHCEHCRRVLTADDRFAGARLKCPGCGGTVIVPKAGETAAARSPAARRKRPLDDEASQEPPVTFGERPSEGDEVDMTPMIDCVFLLLIFFLVTASFALQKSIEIPPPELEHESAKARTVEEISEDEDYVIVRIDKDSTIWVNDSEVIGRQELLAKLRTARQTPATEGGRGPSNLVVMADGDARHESVVMALDAGNAVGMESVRLATVDDEDL